MKKIFSLFLLACLSLAVAAQTKPQALKTIMAKEHLSNTMHSLQKPAHQQAKLVAQQPAEWTSVAYSTAKAPAQLAGLDTTEVYFESFYEDPYFIPADTVVGRNGNTVITPAEWYFVLRNERYQFIFDIINNVNPETMAGTYTEKDLEEWYSWCMFPEANGDTHYYKTCDLTITEERVSESSVKYIVDAVVLATCGIGGEEYGYFKLHAEHTVVKAKQKWDVAILNCKLEAEEDRIRIFGQDDTIAIDLTFYTELGVEGYYSHKLMDTENSKIVHRGVEREISTLEGIIAAAETNTGGMAYVFMFEALTQDAYFYNVAMEAPIIPTDTVEISCINMELDDSWGMSDATIIIQASNSDYEILAAYNDTKISTPKVYGSDKSAVELTDLKADKDITSMQCTLSITGNALKGYEIEIEMLGSDHKYYIMHLVYKEPEVQEIVTLNFTEPSKSNFYIDALGSKELQLANYNGEYSVSFVIPFIDQVMDGEFGKAELFEDQTFIVHHKIVDGAVEDETVTFASVTGKIWQAKDSTFLTASVLGFNGVQYEISMFHTIPTPTEVVAYTFDGLGEDVVDFTNGVSASGIFVLDAISADGLLMAKVNVERIENASVEGTFYNDGKFDHSDFYPVDTWVKVWNASTKAYDEYSVQKGTMTVKVEDKILTAVASFICDNAVQYDLTFITEYARERIAFDSEEGGVDYTYAPESYYEFTTDYVESHNQLYFDMLASDYSNVLAMVFFVDHVDSEITVPEGVYPINNSMELGTVYASPGVAVGGGPIQSYFCYTYVQEDGIYYDEAGLYCLVDGTVTVKKVNGKLSVEVDAVNSYDLPVKLHYNSVDNAVENINADNTTISKRIINGQFVIIRNGQTYDATGALVK